MNRRNLVLGLACGFSAGAAYALKPRRFVSLMPAGKKLSDILPRSFGGWTSRDVSDLVAPETPDSLAARLYGETVGRIYRHPSTNAEVMMLMAHGDDQSNELQLHRPEVCYPAFGFAITSSAPVDLQIDRNVHIPARRLVARSSDHQEAVLYWTRLGEYFPTTLTEQRLMRLETAMHHYIADGLLARFSVAGDDVAGAIDVMQEFVPRLVENVPAGDRQGLIGTRRAELMAAAQPPMAKSASVSRRD